MGNESATEATAKFKFKFMDQNKDGFLDLKEFTDACADMDTATIEGFIAKLYISYSMGARTIYLSVDIEFRYGVKPSHPSAPALGLRRRHERLVVPRHVQHLPKIGMFGMAPGSGAAPSSGSGRCDRVGSC